MRKSVLAFLFLVLCPWLAAQALNNESIIKMAKAGLSEDVILSTVNASAGAYDTTADGLIALKAAGVSDRVIAALVVKGTGAAPAAVPASAPTAADPDDPNSPHDSGVYIVINDASGKKKMVFIDRVGAGRQKTSNVLGSAFSYGIAKAKVKAEIPGSHAVVRTHEARPVFYMFFPSSANLGGFGGNDVITSPSQFSLISLEEKKDHRETAVAKMGFASASAGTDDKRAKLFDVERIRNGVYRLTPKTDLEGGEYAYIASTGTSGSATQHTVVIYDFGVDK